MKEHIGQNISIRIVLTLHEVINICLKIKTHFNFVDKIATTAHGMLVGAAEPSMPLSPEMMRRLQQIQAQRQAAARQPVNSPRQMRDFHQPKRSSSPTYGQIGMRGQGRGAPMSYHHPYCSTSDQEFDHGKYKLYSTVTHKLIISSGVNSFVNKYKLLNVIYNVMKLKRLFKMLSKNTTVASRSTVKPAVRSHRHPRVAQESRPRRGCRTPVCQVSHRNNNRLTPLLYVTT